MSANYVSVHPPKDPIQRLARFNFRLPPLVIVLNQSLSANKGAPEINDPGPGKTRTELALVPELFLKQTPSNCNRNLQNFLPLVATQDSCFRRYFHRDRNIIPGRAFSNEIL